MLNLDKIFGRLGNRMFQMATLYSHAKKLDVDIYFQDEKYFKKDKDEIKKLFGSGITALPYVAIHVRRGDYVNNTFHTDLTRTTYYEEAIKFFPDRYFLVFSDDIGWCKRHFVGDQFLFSEGFDEVDDLNRMAGCQAHIIANSSYSWWAAYLCPFGNVVVAPRENKWFRDGIVRCKLPKKWVQIDFKRHV